MRSSSTRVTSPYSQRTIGIGAAYTSTARCTNAKESLQTPNKSDKNFKKI